MEKKLQDYLRKVRVEQILFLKDYFKELLKNKEGLSDDLLAQKVFDFFQEVLQSSALMLATHTNNLYLNTYYQSGTAEEKMERLERLVSEVMDNFKRNTMNMAKHSSEQLEGKAKNDCVIVTEIKCNRTKSRKKKESPQDINALADSIVKSVSKKSKSLKKK